MPTFERTARFIRDQDGLTGDQKSQFKAAVAEFVEDLKRDGKPRASLRIRTLIDIEPKTHEFTWAQDGRATFQYGDPRRPG